MSSRKKTSKTHRTVSPIAHSLASSKRRKKHRVTWEEYDYYEDNSHSLREGERTKQSQTRSTANQRFSFKDRNFAFRQGAMNKKRAWKNLKQILGNERMLAWQQDDPTYNSIDAPPSFKPVKKYGDLFGLLARYQDPQTGMRFSTAAEFAVIRSLPSDIVQNYLAIRRASIV